MSAAHPYDALTPDVVLDALASIGLHGDGRLLALSSYENRVYQLWLEDPHEGANAVVAKFYRPGRWSEAQILEEHAFSAELAAGEVPAVAPFAIHGATLHHFGGFAFSVSPRWTTATCWNGSAASSRASTSWARSALSPPGRRWTCAASARTRATGWSRTT